MCHIENETTSFCLFNTPLKGSVSCVIQKFRKNTFGYSKDEHTFVIFMIFAKEPLYTVL